MAELSVNSFNAFTMTKEIDFEKIYGEIEEAVKILESGEGSISKNIEIYKQAIEKIKKAKKVLESAENEIKEITAEK